LKQLNITNEIICPSCRTITPGNLDSIKKNTSLMILLEEIRKENEEKINTPIFCEECNEKATVFCVQCNIALCDPHNVNLHAFKINSNHKRYDISKKLVKKIAKCTEHDELLKLFCNHCNISICFLCGDHGNHSGHNIQLISGIMKDYQSQIEDIIKDSNLLVQRFDDYLKELNNTVDKLKENVGTREKDIDTVMDNLITVINQRRLFLKEEIKKQTIEEEKIINNQREVIVNSSAEIHSLLIELKSILLNINHDILSKRNMETFKNKLKEWDKLVREIEEKKN
jgi:hypothetical protein